MAFAEGFEPPPPERSEDGRHIIRLPGRRVDVVDATIAALSELELFQRGGGLVDIVRDPEPGEGGVFVPTGEPRVRIIPFSRVYELTTMACQYIAKRKDEKKSEATGKTKLSDVEVDPPTPVVKTLMDRGEWSHIRPLDAMVSWPVLRPNGSVFDGVGYDAQTRCYSTGTIRLDIPPCITPDHVANARAKLDDIIGQFPFERPEHRSVWFAALLSVLARPAIRGPVPMFIFDANDRGSGKTLLCDTIGAILTGNKLPRRGVPDKDEEWGKIMLGIGIGGYPMILFDNVNGTLKSATLDMVLTGESFQNRVLGLNKEMKVPIRTVFLVSSNNAMVSTDLVRRSLNSRLAAPERPEMRTGWKHDLPAAAVEMRGELLSAAFTILLGYEQAGRPRQTVRPLGSYESWSERIQSVLVWAGMPDPVVTQDELRVHADQESDQLDTLIVAWAKCFGAEEKKASEVVRYAVDYGTATRTHSPEPRDEELLSALELIADGRKLTAGLLGYRLRKWRNKWRNGVSFQSVVTSGGVNKWAVSASPGNGDAGGMVG